MFWGYFALKRVYSPISNIISNLEEKAEHDQLTGLLNKISFLEIGKLYMYFLLRNMTPGKTEERN